ncbi:unnamed protein product [Pleuronectes platessa]|uniref:Uncharacterized protein n=1 Tax=Pleuronectes platessa TaxID=8262 RepID=A0A9N7VYY7_PLEPL|nr:unnamed protein product [Pleuronectes platessa]
MFTDICTSVINLTFTISLVFVVKPLGTCRGWGSSRPVAFLSTPPENPACGTPRRFFFWGGGSSSAVPHGVSGAGAFFLFDRGVVSPAGAEGGQLEGTGYGGRRRRLWTRVGTFSRITSAAAPAGGTLCSSGGPLPAVRLGWRLAADKNCALNVKVKKFNEARVNGGCNYWHSKQVNLF